MNLDILRPTPYANAYVTPSSPKTEDLLTQLRSKSTSTADFRAATRLLVSIEMDYASAFLETAVSDIETPLTSFSGRKLVEKKTFIFPILRAGLAMLDTAIEALPWASVGVIGARRNEQTLEPEIYCHNPSRLSADVSEIFVIDPMCATGGSAIHAIERIKHSRQPSELPLNIRFISIISAPEGLRAMARSHPDVLSLTCVVDDKLNDNGYIVPGLGDFGDRYFGTL